MTNDNIAKILKDFLLNIECLSPLEKSSFNIFDVLKIARTEIRHSNVLAWLLNPNENHGFGKAFIARLNSYIAKDGLVSDEVAFKLLTMKYSDIVVYREWQNIDILIESQKEKYILCIENKVDSQDHDGQLDKYYNVIEDKYPEFTKIYLYLTPEGLAPLQDSNSAWGCIKYETIIRIIEIELEKAIYDSETVSFIRSYLITLRRETMENNEIIELCQQIYAEHKEALDLIFENRPDRLQNVSEFFKEWCKKQHEKGLIYLDEEKCSKSYIRFRTPFMEEHILKSNGISGWNTKNHYYYEICSYCDKNDTVSFAIQLSFNSANLEAANLAQLENIIKAIQPNKTLKDNWQWKTVFKSRTEKVKGDEILPEDFDGDNALYTKLDKMLSEIQKNEKFIATL